MKYIKSFNINEAMFDSSTLEDILYEFTDEGFGWDIALIKSSKGKVIINVYIIITHNKRIGDLINIEQSIIRIDKYLKSEGYIQADSTVDIIDEIENNDFCPGSWTAEYDNDESTLQLTYKKE